MAQIDDIFMIMIRVVNTFGAPLLAVFLLGMFTRRTTAKGAAGTLVTGTLFTLWLMLANTSSALQWLWPWQTRLNDIWPLTLGVVFSLVWGYTTSLFIGNRRSRTELRGYVVGCGTLGVREPEEAAIAIPDSFDSDQP
jgi:Na+/proline symporter